MDEAFMRECERHPGGATAPRQLRDQPEEDIAMDQITISELEARLKQLVDCAADGINQNEINYELECLVKWTAFASEQAAQLLKMAINSRLKELQSQYHLETALSCTEQGKVSSGLVFIVDNFNLRINKAIRVLQLDQPHDSLPATEILCGA